MRSESVPCEHVTNPLCISVCQREEKNVKKTLQGELESGVTLSPYCHVAPGVRVLRICQTRKRQSVILMLLADKKNVVQTFESA